MRKVVIGILLIIVAAIIFGNMRCEKASEEKDINSLFPSAVVIAEHHRRVLRDSATAESLIFWTSDTTWKCNPELVVLLDSLFQHVRNDSISKTVKEEELWMSSFRQKLCKQYSQLNIGSEAISEFAKADSVISVANRLYDLDNDESTMGMVVHYSISYTFDVFQENNLLSQLLSICDSSIVKDYVYKEWDLYERMFKLMARISTNLTYLNYWGGSIVGPINSANYCLLSSARREMYTEIIKLYRGDSYSDRHGQYLILTSKLLFEALDITLKNALEYSKDYKSNELKRYMATAKEVEKDICKLRPLVKNWVELWDKLDYELTTDGSRHNAERIASTMLIEWASIASAN